MLLFILFFAWLAFDTARLLSGPEIWRALLQSLTFGLISAMVIVGTSPFTDRRIMIWRIPDESAVGALVMALFILRDAAPARSRSASYGRAAALEIASGATVIERIQSRSLLAVQPAYDSPAWRQLRQRAGALRALAADAAIGTSSERTALQCRVAQAIVAAAAGEWDELPDLHRSAPVPEAHFHRRPARSFLRWIVTAVLPPAALIGIVLVGRNQGLALNTKTVELLAQGALLWLVVQTNAALDPAGYHQKLGLMTSMGGGLFGFGKAKSG